MINRAEEIRRQNLILEGTGNGRLDYSKIRVGAKTLEDAILNIGEYKRINPILGDKKEVLMAMNTGDIEKMR